MLTESIRNLSGPMRSLLAIAVAIAMVLPVLFGVPAVAEANNGSPKISVHNAPAGFKYNLCYSKVEFKAESLKSKTDYTVSLYRKGSKNDTFISSTSIKNTNGTKTGSFAISESWIASGQSSSDFYFLLSWKDKGNKTHKSQVFTVARNYDGCSPEVTVDADEYRLCDEISYTATNFSKNKSKAKVVVEKKSKYGNNWTEVKTIREHNTGNGTFGGTIDASDLEGHIGTTLRVKVTLQYKQGKTTVTETATSSTFKILDDDCQPPPPQCDEGYELQDGKCVLVCPEGHEVQDGECVLVCGEGYEVQDGECVLVCDEGYTLEDGDCIKVCEEGYTADGDDCYPICDEDENWVDGDCVPVCEVGEWNGQMCVTDDEDEEEEEEEEDQQPDPGPEERTRGTPPPPPAQQQTETTVTPEEPQAGPDPEDDPGAGEDTSDEIPQTPPAAGPDLPFTGGSYLWYLLSGGALTGAAGIQLALSKRRRDQAS